LQESAAAEALVSETYNKVGKFVKEDLFHHKKFVNDDNDLNDIMDEGSLGKRTMDYFNISVEHVQEGSGGCHCESKECRVIKHKKRIERYV
jgi:hypothetical protein